MNFVKAKDIIVGDMIKLPNTASWMTTKFEKVVYKSEHSDYVFLFHTQDTEMAIHKCYFLKDDNVKVLNVNRFYSKQKTESEEQLQFIIDKLVEV